MYQSVKKINQNKPQSMKDDDFNERSRLKYSFHIVPFLENQSKLMQGNALKEFSEFEVKHDTFFCTKH